MNKVNYLDSSLHVPNVYHRRYDLDLPEHQSGWKKQAKRVVLTVLPFISLYRPAGAVLSLGMGTTRTLSYLWGAKESNDWKHCSIELMHGALAALSVASTLFYFPLGLAVSTGFDVLQGAYNVHACSNNSRKMVEELLQTLSSVLYLGLMFSGGLEIMLLSTFIQGAVSFLQAQGEFSKGRYLEGTAKMAFGFIRIGQLKPILRQIEIYNKKIYLVKRTVTELNKSINQTPVSQEQERLIAIAKRLSADLVKFIPCLRIAPVPGCCLYQGENYLASVVAIAEKQEVVEHAIKYIKTANGFDEKVSNYFHNTLRKLQSGNNVALPNYFHATRAGLENIIKTQTIYQSILGRAGPGTYISSNNEGNYGYGSHAFAIDEGCLVDTKATFFRGRQGFTNVFDSLWSAVLMDIPVTENTIAFIDTSANDISYVKDLLEKQNLNIEVVDRCTAENILNIFDMTTKRRELPSFFWQKAYVLGSLPQNMYPRSEKGRFEQFTFGL